MLTSIEWSDRLSPVLVDNSPVGLAKPKRHIKRTKKMSTDTNTTEQSAKDKAMNEAQAKVDAINTDRGTAKGTRLKVGATRGKGSQVITFEAFDESKPETLPTSITEFAQLAGIDTSDGKATEKQLVEYMIDGYNSASYTNASDPIAEYVNPTWTPEQQKAFKLVVKNMVANAGLSLDDTVAMIKPVFEKNLSKMG